MNDFDTLGRIVAHAEAWRLDDHRLLSVRLAGQPVVRLHDDDVSAFASWVEHLSQKRMQVERGASLSLITVSGLILCGKPISVVMTVLSSLVPEFVAHDGLSIEDFVAVAATRQRVLAPAKAGA
ncbi:hypothetical protein [Amycolatopsis circi]|uniref:hypothetical protein n=1 Tax=Amycolatopsis circi TaxID=871959 RepID=UPI0013BEA23E|nr:hypothetical protein [Amycolatopsis circi]